MLNKHTHIMTINDFVGGKIYKTVINNFVVCYFKFKCVVDGRLDYYWEVDDCGEFSYKDDSDVNNLYGFNVLDITFEEILIDDIKHLVPQKIINDYRKIKIKNLLNS